MALDNKGPSGLWFSCGENSGDFIKLFRKSTHSACQALTTEQTLPVVTVMIKLALNKGQEFKSRVLPFLFACGSVCLASCTLR